jgi:hypothetical protein
MNASEMTFGIEIETTAGRTAMNAGLRVGSYNSAGIQVPYLPAGWNAKHDGSIRATHHGRIGAEIVSPVLKGAEGLLQVIEVVKKLKAMGHAVNVTCGVHVHVGFAYDASPVSLAKLVTAVAYCEAGLYAVTGTKKREQGTYCKSVKAHGSVDRATRATRGDRYHALNLTNYASRKRPAVEFRIFSGSLNAVKIAAWVQVCLGLVEASLSNRRSVKWNPAPLKATGGHARAGKGRSECERLIGYLAWSSGYAKKYGGRMFGWLDVVSLDNARDELRRMATKYDAEASAIEQAEADARAAREALRETLLAAQQSAQVSMIGR